MAIKKLAKAIVVALTIGAMQPALLVTSESASAAYGELDTTYGGNGTGYNYISANVAGMATPLRGDRLENSALDSQERLVVVGRTVFDGGDQSAFTIARFNSDGALDLTFGSNQNGFESLQIGDEDGFEAVGIQSNGKIIAAGYSDNGGSIRWVVARFLSSGVLDTTFGSAGTGYVIENFGLSAIAKSIVVLANDDLIVAGRSNVDPSNSANLFLPTFAKYDSNGGADLSFGQSGTGRETFTVGAEGGEIKAIKTLSNGDIVAAGNTLGLTQNPLLALLSNTGNLRLNFGGHNSGYETTSASVTNSGLSSLAVLPSGKILAAGSADAGTTGLVARYNSNGTLDTGFGTGNDGFVRLQAIDQTALNDIEITTNNGFVVAGYSVANINGAYKFLIAKYNENGSLDSTFGSQSGYFLENISSNDEVKSIVFNSAQEIIFAGQSFGPSSTRRLLTVGKLSGSTVSNSSQSVSVLSVPDPTQQSFIESVTVTGETTTAIVLTGKFPEPIVNIVLNQAPIAPTQWQQTPVSVTIPEVKPGDYTIQIFNGAVPLLPEQYVLVEVNVLPSTSPKPQVTTAPARPLEVENANAPKTIKTDSFKVYFAMASARLDEKSKESIRTWFEESGRNARMLNITGYAQATPKGASLDPALSARRARAVKNFFIGLGYSGKFRTSGAGRTALNSAESRYVEVLTL